MSEKIEVKVLRTFLHGAAPVRRDDKIHVSPAAAKQLEARGLIELVGAAGAAQAESADQTKDKTGGGTGTPGGVNGVTSQDARAGGAGTPAAPSGANAGAESGDGNAQPSPPPPAITFGPGTASGGGESGVAGAHIGADLVSGSAADSVAKVKETKDPAILKAAQAAEQAKGDGARKTVLDALESAIAAAGKAEG
ncbi:hypothetical protein EA658_09790 [Pseudoxanthomonas winnipegensis]|uniref:Uncharacterized protein n=1 Tax=Pseudoxanthomonas winnipegensis TaxID=2480810 RepID=A0ABY1WCN9_9GAMM|nr:hypothetical protein [Pseudoxanthomonas winnipegensis]TAA12473.1 hypothetical protein EA659_03860 [Pseudoxanthomonas winnipegensis]TAA19162.1 hypothetical protein EA658_09790 [Pseudoxanthomonas winnipegensis]TAH70423.1 hypothetical protein EA657_16855 [Pseudoxanthomonas winnipegensis]